MGLVISKIAAALLVLALLVGGYVVAVLAGAYYPCSLPALTAYQAKQQVGHFMRTAGVNQKALDLISGLRRMGADTQIIDRLNDNCRDCILSTESIDALQSVWAASLIFPVLGRQTTSLTSGWHMGTQHVVLQIGLCRAVWIERSLLEPPDLHSIRARGEGAERG